MKCKLEYLKRKLNEFYLIYKSHLKMHKKKAISNEIAFLINLNYKEIRLKEITVKPFSIPSNIWAIDLLLSLTNSWFKRVESL